MVAKSQTSPKSFHFQMVRCHWSLRSRSVPTVSTAAVTLWGLLNEWVLKKHTCWACRSLGCSCHWTIGVHEFPIQWHSVTIHCDVSAMNFMKQLNAKKKYYNIINTRYHFISINSWSRNFLFADFPMVSWTRSPSHSCGGVQQHLGPEATGFRSQGPLEKWRFIYRKHMKTYENMFCIFSEFLPFCHSAVLVRFRSTSWMVILNVAVARRISSSRCWPPDINRNTRQENGLGRCRVVNDCHLGIFLVG